MTIKSASSQSNIRFKECPDFCWMKSDIDHKISVSPEPVSTIDEWAIYTSPSQRGLTQGVAYKVTSLNSSYRLIDDDGDKRTRPKYEFGPICQCYIPYDTSRIPDPFGSTVAEAFPNLEHISRMDIV